MKHIKIFESYIAEDSILILEKSINVGDDLLQKLNKINKPIANKLKNFLNSNDIKDSAKISKIDYDEKDGKMFTIIDDNGKERKFKLGKLLTYIGFDTSTIKQYEVEDFLRYFKKSELSDLKVVRGEDILKSYLCDNYDDSKGHGDLYSSCMRFSSSQKFLEIYTANPNQVSCLTLINPKNKRVSARALLWKMDNGEVYMDRIYSVNHEYKALFYKYAEENDITDKVTSDVTLEQGGEYEYYPYMDTFYHYTPSSGKLSNSDGDITLQSTRGGHSDDNMIWSDYYNEEIALDESVYCDRLDTYIYEHDAVEVYNGRSDNGGFKPTVWDLEKEVVKIDITSKQFEEFNGSYAYDDDVYELEGDRDLHILVDDDEIYVDDGWGIYLRNSAFDAKEFNKLDSDLFAIEVTYKSSDHYETSIPMEDATSIWSFDEDDFVIIHENDDMDEFDEDNGELYIEHSSEGDVQYMTNTVHLPESFITGTKENIITEDAPIYMNIMTKDYHIKNEHTTKLYRGAFFQEKTLKFKGVETKGGWKLFPPLMIYNKDKGNGYEYFHYDDYANLFNKLYSRDKNTAFFKIGQYYINSLNEGIKLENELLKVLKDKEFHAMDDFRNINFINGGTERSGLMMLLKNYIVPNVMGTDLYKIHAYDEINNMSFHYSYYRTDDYYIFPFVNKDEKYLVYDRRERDKDTKVPRLKMYTMSEIYDLVNTNKLF